MSKKYSYEAMKRRRDAQAHGKRMVLASRVERAYLASSKCTTDFKQAVASSMDRYESYLDDDLYAIVLPAGTGKTYYAKRYGLIDVDDLVSAERHNELVDMRRSMLEKHTIDWAKHNDVWYGWLRESVARLPPGLKVVMVHSQEAAMEIGATVIGATYLSESAHESNIANRSREARALARMNRSVVVNRTNFDIVEMADNDAVHRWLLATLCVWEVPVGAPYQYSKVVPNPWYGEHVPDWVTTGDTSKLDLEFLISLHEAGHVPKECVDFFVRNGTEIGTAMGYGITNYEWGKFVGMANGNVNRRVDVNLDDDLFVTYPPRSDAEKNRVNVTLRRLLSVVGTDLLRDGRKVLERHVGESHIFVSTLFSHHCGLGDRVGAVGLEWVYYLKEDKWRSITKRLHELVRLSSTYGDREMDEAERQALMYMNMCHGRKLYSIDAQNVVDERNFGTTEVLHKSYDPDARAWTVAQYIKDFNSVLRLSYESVIHHKRVYDVSSFLDFWKKRRDWLAKGSTVLSSIPASMKKYVVELVDNFGNKVERSARHNKKSLFESVDVLALMRETVDTFNSTKVVVKLNETGKERALMPGTLCHYIVFSYVLWLAEQGGQVGHVRVNALADDDLSYFESRMFTSLHHVMYDWANFNAQHSSYEMARVIELLAQADEAPDDYSAFCFAISESMWHMNIVDDSGNRVPLERGLYSGWRGTSWINGVLNNAYVNVGLINYRRLNMGSEPVYADGGGDDEDIAFIRLASCDSFLWVMNKMGFEAQAIKQMVDSRAEFFRNTMSANGMHGNPTRALANFCSGNWESGASLAPRERIAGVLDNTARLRRRGVNPKFCAALELAVTMHWAKVRTDSGWVKLSGAVMHGRQEDGGLGIPDERGCVWRLEDPVPSSFCSSAWTQLPGVAVTQDKVDAIAEEVKELGLTMHDRADLVLELAGDSYDMDVGDQYLEWERIANHQSRVVRYEPVVEVLVDHEVWDCFLNFSPDPELASLVSRVDAYMPYLPSMRLDGNRVDKAQLCKLVCGMEVSVEVLDFRGNIYYRRLVPDYVGA